MPSFPAPRAISHPSFSSSMESHGAPQKSSPQRRRIRALPARLFGGAGRRFAANPPGRSRRIAAALSLLFLLSMAAIAALGSARAAGEEEGAEPIGAGTLMLHP